ncbi:cyclin-like protein [Elasticomyces elasticus]|nr:cyclin-like protein [Elasticomyces elasticus]
MPSFYGPRSNQLPITPPDSGSGYAYGDIYPQDPYQAQQSLSQPRHEGAYEYPQSYLQPAVAPAPPAYPYAQSNYQQPTTLPSISSYYEPIGAPTLPPLRINNGLNFTDDYQRRLQQEQQSAAAREQQQRQAVKEEKATGGVSAKLDYDMERMTDFVTDATMTMYALHLSPICVADVDVTRSFHHKMQSPPSFRKWVLQVLSATRLPSSTIMLSLHYLNERVAHFGETVSTSENQIYRLLAVSLILGSKFLDDNTFINRSWSDVTAIKVTELNQLEVKWLQLIHWELHVDPNATNGLQAWLNSWAAYQEKDVVKQPPSRLSPLDTNVHGRVSSHRDRYSPYPTPHSAAPSRAAYETAHSIGYSAPAPAQYANASYASDMWAASERQSNIDDYYRRSNRYSTVPEANDYGHQTSAAQARQSTYQYPQTAQTSYYQTPAYGSAWDQGAWNAAHRYDCQCSACAYQQHYRPYAPSYTQTVMG